MVVMSGAKTELGWRFTNLGLPIENRLSVSRNLLDAVTFGNGTTIFRVKRAISSEYTVMWEIDGVDVLLEFARLCALDVAHLWDAPDIVTEYLASGSEILQCPARDMARTALAEASQFRTKSVVDGARVAVYVCDEGPRALLKTDELFLVRCVASHASWLSAMAAATAEAEISLQSKDAGVAPYDAWTTGWDAGYASALRFRNACLEGLAIAAYNESH